MLVIFDRSSGALLGACNDWPVALRAVKDCASAGIKADVRQVFYTPKRTIA